MNKALMVVAFTLSMFCFHGCAPQFKGESTRQAEVPGITEKYWRLTELFGKPVAHHQTSQKEAYIILKTEGNRIQGNTGCNFLAGTYELKKGNRIAFSQIAVTRMACQNMEIEIQFLKVLNAADSYVVTADKLTLNRAKMAPLARLEAAHAK